MMRIAIGYGAWSAALAFATVAVAIALDVLGNHSVDILGNPLFSLNAFLFLFFVTAFPTFGVAILSWIVLHRRERHPGWIDYGFLAMGVVIATQLLIALLVAIWFQMATPLEFVRLNAWFLIVHGWYTMPIALVGTALFVWWLKRDVTVPPSRVDRVGWRS